MKTITVNIKHEDRAVLERKVEDYLWLSPIRVWH